MNTAGAPGQTVSEAVAEVPAEHDTAHQSFLGLSTTAWVGVAFVIFVIILWRAGMFRAIAGGLDARAEKVKADLAEAAALRAEAEQLKARAAEEAAQAERDAATMRANAEREAEALVVKARADADAAIARRQRMAEDRITAAQRAAEADLRARAAQLATAAARDILAAKAANGELVGLTDQAIATISGR